MSATHGLNLASLACKYLKYLSQQRTCSDHTSKSYANDLGQFLGPLGVLKILPEPSTPSASFQIIWKETPIREHVQSSDILTLVREVQALWGGLSPASRNRKTVANRVLPAQSAGLTDAQTAAIQ